VETAIKTQETERDDAMKTLDELAGSRELFRGIAKRGAIIYRLASRLSPLDPFYQFSFPAFSSLFDHIIEQTKHPSSDDRDTPAYQSERVDALRTSVTQLAYMHVAGALNEQHKLVFASQVAVLVSQSEKSEPSVEEADVLLAGAVVGGGAMGAERLANPLGTWLSDMAWDAACGLACLPALKRLPASLQTASEDWRAWLPHGSTSSMPAMPSDDTSNVTQLSDFQQLLVVLALCPQRLPNHLRSWAQHVLGCSLSCKEDLVQSIKSIPAHMPTLFLLQPQQPSPVNDLITIGRTGYEMSDDKLVRLELGRGVEHVAAQSLQQMLHRGGWLVLEKIELLASWLPVLVEQLASQLPMAHRSFRLFLTASAGQVTAVPSDLLTICFKQASEPPTSFKSSLLTTYKELREVPQAKELDGGAGEAASAVPHAKQRGASFHALVLALCVLHTVLMQRRRFGPIGWNIHVPFTTCARLAPTRSHRHRRTRLTTLTRVLCASCASSARVPCLCVPSLRVVSACRYAPSFDQLRAHADRGGSRRLQGECGAGVEFAARTRRERSVRRAAV
jgi:dynein heavy chain